MNPRWQPALEIALLFLIVFSTLFFGAVHPWARLSLSAILLGIFAVFFSSEVLKGLPRIFIFSLLAVGAWVPIQIFVYSWNPYASTIQGIQGAAMAAAFLSALLLPPQSLRNLMLFMMCWIPLLAFYGTYEILSVQEHVLWMPKTAYLGFLTGSYVNKNHFAGLLELALGIQAGVLFSSLSGRRRSWVFLSAVLLGVTLFFLVLTGSRLGLLSFMTALTAGALLSGISKKNWKPMILAVILIAGGAFCFREPVLSRFQDPGAMWSLQGRLELWKTAGLIFKDYGITGVGSGCFKWAILPYQSENFLAGWDHAHNDYLEMALTLGIPGFLVLAAGFLSLILKILKSFSQGLESGDRWLAWGAMTGLLSLSIHSFGDFNFSIPGTVFCALLTLAWILRILCPRPVSVPLRRPIQTCVKIAALVMAFVALFLARQNLEAYQAENFVRNGQWAEAIHAYEKAGLQNPEVLYALGELYYKKAQKESSGASRTGNFQKAEDYFNRTSRRIPRFGRARLYRITALQEARGGLKAALSADEKNLLKKEIREALALEPGSAWVHYGAAAVFLKLGDVLSAAEKEEAFGWFRKSIRLRDENQPPRYLRPALELLFQTGEGLESFKKITPEDELSTRELLAFLEEKNDWKSYAEVKPVYEKMRDAAYENEIQSGRAAWERGNYEESLDYFQKAHWLNQSQSDALLGMLGSQFYLGEHGNFEDLGKIVRDLDADLRPWEALLDTLVPRFPQAYLRGLYQARAGRWPEAVGFLKTALEDCRASKAKCGREEMTAFLAEAYWQSGKKEDALALLAEALKSKENFYRLLEQFRDRETPLREAVRLRLKSLELREIPPGTWWAPGHQGVSMLKTRARLGTVVRVPPGKCAFGIEMKSTAGKASPQDSAYAVVRLNLGDIEKTIGSVYVESSSKKTYEFSYVSGGGERWLEVELYNGREKSEKLKGPSLELGAVKIKCEA